MAKQPGENGVFNLDKVRKFEINQKEGIYKCDDTPEDRAGLLEAMAILNGSKPRENQSVNSSVVSPTTDKGLRLDDLLEQYFLLKSTLAPETATAYKQHIKDLKDFVKNRPLLTILCYSDRKTPCQMAPYPDVA